MSKFSPRVSVVILLLKCKEGLEGRCLPLQSALWLKKGDLGGVTEAHGQWFNVVLPCIVDFWQL